MMSAECGVKRKVSQFIEEIIKLVMLLYPDSNPRAPFTESLGYICSRNECLIYPRELTNRSFSLSCEQKESKVAKKRGKKM